MHIDTDEELEALAEYCADGRRRALEYGNRGPVRFVGDRALHPEIVEAYWRTGFYVFEGLSLRPVHPWLQRFFLRKIHETLC